MAAAVAVALLILVKVVVNLELIVVEVADMAIKQIGDGTSSKADSYGEQMWRLLW